MTTILVESGQISSNFSLGGSGSLLDVEQGGTAENALLFSNVSALIEGVGSDISLIGGVGTVESGGVLVSATFSTSFNGTTNYLFVSSGGTAIATTMEAGSAQVFSGGLISNINIDSGAVTTIFGGGSEIGTTLSGGTDTVSSGGLSISTTIVSSGGQQFVYGFASGTVISLPDGTNGAQQIFSGGTAANTVLSGDSAEQVISAGGTAIGTTNISGSQLILSGGTASNTILSGNTASGDTLEGFQEVLGGLAVGTTVDSGGYLDLNSGQVTTAVISVGGQGEIDSGATATSLTLLSGGTLLVYADATNSAFTWSGGTLQLGSAVASSGLTVTGPKALLLSGGTAVSAVVGAGGNEIVESGGTASRTTVDIGGTETVGPHGLAVSASVSGGVELVASQGATSLTTVFAGTQTVEGRAIDTTVRGGGLQLVLSGGTEGDAFIQAGGTQIVMSGGEADITWVSSGGLAIGSSGGGVDGFQVLSGGTLELMGGVTAPISQVEFLQSGSVVEIGSGYTLLNYATGPNSIVLIDVTNGIQSGSIVEILSSGIASGTVVENTGSEIVGSGGSAIGTTLEAGGRLEVQSGGVNQGLTWSGGTLQLDSGVVSSGLVISAGQILALSGGTAVSATLLSGGSETVGSGGLDVSATLVNGGTQIVRAGGITSGARLNDNGSAGSAGQIVSSGGTAIGTVISTIGLDSATQTISSGGTATGTMLSGSWALQVVSSGGMAISTTVVSGTQYLSAGGTAIGAVVTGSTISGSTDVGSQEAYGGVAISTLVLSGGVVAVANGGTVSVVTVSSGGTVIDYSEGVASNTVVSAGGSLVISAGLDEAATILSGGVENVSLGGLDTGTVVSAGGSLVINAGGTAKGTVVTGAGADENVLSGGRVIGTILRSGATLELHNGTFNTEFTWSGGTLQLDSGVTPNFLPILRGQTLVLAGGTASATTVSSGGRMIVESGGSASGTVVSSGATLEMQSGGTNTGLTWSGGTLQLDSGVSSSGLVVSSGRTLLLSGGTGSGDTISGGGTEIVLSGGTASGETLSGGTAVGVAVASAGATVVSTTLAGGSLQIQSGASVSGVSSTAAGGFITVSSGGVVASTSVADGKLTTMAGGTSIDATVSSIESDAVGGLDVSATVTGTGVLNVAAGGVASATLISGMSIGLGHVSIFAGGTGLNITEIAGSVTDLGSMTGTTLSSGGSLVVSRGGVASGTTISSGGVETVSSGGAASGTTIDVGGTLDVKSGAIVQGLNWSGGTLQLDSGAASNGITLAEGQTLLLAGGTASNTTLTGGTEIVEAGGVAFDTVISGGVLDIAAGGSATGDVSFGASGGTYEIDGTSLPAAPIVGFDVGDTIDLTGIAFDPAGSATLGIGNTLTITEGGSSYTLQFDPSQDFLGDSFALAGDGTSGTDLTVTTGGPAVVSSGQVLTISTNVTATPIAILSGGQVDVVSGGTTLSDTISGGSETIAAGGTAISANLLSGGVETVQAGGSALSPVIGSGGEAIVAGGISGATLGSGGLLEVQSGATNTGLAWTGGTLQLDSGVTLTNLTVSSGRTVIFSGGTAGGTLTLAGGTASGTRLVNGNSETILSGGLDVNGAVATSGSQTISSGGVASSTVVSGNLAIQSVTSGGVAIGAMIGSGGIELVSFDGTTTGTTLTGGGTETVSSGAVASATDVGSAGFLNVLQGGTASGAVVTNFGQERVSGVDVGAQISTGGSATVLGGGIASNSTISLGGVQSIGSGGSATRTTIGAGGTQVVGAAGSASSATVSSGGIQAVSNGATNSTTVLVGGTQTVMLGSAFATVVSAGGTQIASLFGIDDTSRIASGGSEVVQANGSSTEAEIQSGGQQTVAHNGVSFLAQISAGGHEIVAGTASSTTLLSGGTLEMQSGGTDPGLAWSGGTLQLDSGVASTGLVVSSGRTLVLSGGTASNTTVLSGGSEIVLAGGNASGNTVSAGGGVTASAGATVMSTTLAGGSLQVQSGAAVSVVSSTPAGGIVQVNSGAVVTSTSIIDGKLTTLAGGTSIAAIVTSIELDTVSGLDVGGTISGTGVMDVASGGIASGTLVSGTTGIGKLEIDNGGIASDTTITAGTELVAAGGTANGVTFAGPGTLDLAQPSGLTGIISGLQNGDVFDFQNTNVTSAVIAGSTLSVTVAGATTYTYQLANPEAGAVLALSGDGSGGTDVTVDDAVGGDVTVSTGQTLNGLNVASGGAVTVQPGGTVVGTTIQTGGALDVGSGGAAASTTVDSGGSETITTGGSDSGTVLSGGDQLDDGTATSDTVAAGGTQTVGSGGVASATTIDSGGSQLVGSGGTADGTTIAGGTEYVSAGAAVSGVTFSGPGGALDLQQPLDVGGAIAGFQSGDQIDLIGTVVTGLSFAAGVLDITGPGGPVGSLDFTGDYSGSEFVFTSDGAGGTDIALGGPPPTATPQSYTVDENTALSETAAQGLLVGATGQNLVATIAAEPSDGTVSINPDGSFTYTPGANFYGTDSFTYTASDSEGTGVSAPQTATIGVADTAVLQDVLPAGGFSGTENGAISLGAVSVSDNPNANDPTLTATLQVADGVIAVAGNGGAAVTGAGTNSVTLQGTEAEINTALTSATYTPNANFYGTDTLSVTIGDGGGQTTAGSASITVSDTTMVSATLGGSYSGNENTLVPLGGLAVAASPNSGDALTAVLSVARGTVSAGGQTGASITLSGTASQIDSVLSGASYQGAANYYGSDTLSLTVSDTADGSHAAGSASIVLGDTSVPAQTIGTSYSGTENTLVPLGGLGVSVSPNSTDPLTTVLSVASGTVSAGGMSGASITLSGTAAQIDSVLSGASYQGGVDFYGSDTLSMATTDTVDGNRITGSASISLADATMVSATLGGPYGGSENTVVPLGGLAVAASPNGSDPLTAVLSVAHGTVSAGGESGASITVSGTAAQIDAALSGTTYGGGANYYGSDTVSLTVSDTVDGSHAAGSASIVLSDTSVPAQTIGASYSGTENTVVPLGGISVSVSPNAGDPLKTVLTVQSGTVSAGGKSGASITLSGTAAQIDSVLSGATYQGGVNFYGSDTLSMATTDTVDGSHVGGSASISLADATTVSASLVGPYGGNENTVVPLGGLAVTASPNGGDPLMAVLSVAHGMVSAGGQTGASITLSGTAAQIDAVLSGATYEGGANYYGPDTVSLTVGDTADGASASAMASITLSDTSLPAQAIGASYTGTENTLVPLGGLSISVSPNGGDPLTTVLSVASGTVSAGGQSGASITLSGTAAQIDSVLSGASYRGDLNFYGSDTLSMATTDIVDGSQVAASATISLTDATLASATLSGPYAGSENMVVPLGGLAVAASPNSGDLLAAVLSVAHGAVSAGGQSGASITLTGTAAQIDSVLSGATYDGAANYYGPDTLSLTVSDTVDGSHAAGSTLIVLSDTSVPAQTIGVSYTGAENTLVPLGGLSVSVSPNGGDPLAAVLSVDSGTVSAGGQSGGSITLSGTAAQIDSALSGASYRGDLNFYGSDVLSMATTDTVDGSHVGGSAAINLGNETTVSATLGGPYSGAENSLVVLGGLAVAASPNGGDLLSAVLSVGHGTVSAGGQAGASITLTGTAAQIDGVLSGASYEGGGNYYGPDTLSLTVSDTADGSQAAGSASIVLGDTSVPAQTIGASYNGTENTVVPLGGLSVSASPNGGDPLTTVLSVASGTVSADGQSGASITLSGTAVQIDSALSGASYHGGVNFYGFDTLSMATTDTVDGSKVAGSASISLADATTVSATLGGPYTGSENTVVPLGGVAVAASPNGSDPLTAVLSVAHGTVSAGGQSGASIALTGTAAQIDSVLSGASYQGAANYYGSDTLSLTVSDTADGSHAATSASIVLNDTSVPAQTIGASYGGAENTAVQLGGLSVSVSPNSGDPLTTVLSVQSGTVSAGGMSGTSITLSGTAAQIDSALSGASYRGGLNLYGSDALSMTTTDTVDGQKVVSGASIVLSDAATVSATLGGPYTGNENTVVPLGGLAVAASPNSTDPLSTTLSVAHGTVSAGGRSGASITLSGTAAQIDNVLSGASYQGAANYYGSDTLSLAVSDTADGSHATGSASIALSDTSVPAQTIGASYSGAENTVVPLGGLSVSVSPNGGDPMTTVLSVQSGTVSAGGMSGTSITLSGTAAQIDSVLSGASYRGGVNFYGSDALSMATTDTVDGQKVVSGASIVLSDATTVSATLGGPYTGNENTVVPLGGLAVAASPNSSDPLAAVLSVAHGAVSAGGQSGASITLSGTAAQIDSVLSGASYQGAANYYGADTLSLTVSDTADGSRAGGSASIVLSDTGVPAQTIGASYSGAENTVVPLGGLSVSVSPNAGDPLKTVLTVQSGTVSAGGLSGASITLSGTAAQIDSALSGASYQGDVNFYGFDTLSMATTDTADGRATGAATASIAVSDTTAPGETVGGPYSGNENAAIGLTISVSASPNTGDPLSTTLSVAHGTVSAGGQSGASITLTGTAATIDTALAGARYTGAAGFSGGDTLSMTTTDTQDHLTTGAKTAAITVNPVAETPSLSVTAGSGNENGAPIALTITAAQAAGNLSPANLTITVSGLAGGSLNHGTINANGSVTLTPAQLTGLSYTPTPNTYGTVNLSVTATDSEASSATSATTSPQTLAVTVADISVPAETVAGPYPVNENGSLTLTNALSVSVSPNSGDPLSTVLGVAHGTLTVGSAAGATIGGNGTGAVTIAGTSAAIDAALASVVYTPTTGYSGADSLSVTTTDGVDAQQAAKSAAITVNPTASQAVPGETLGGPYSGNENTAVVLGGLGVSETPNSGDPLSAVLSVADGTITIAASGGATVSGSGTGTVTVHGSVTQIDAALAGASYKGAANFYGSDTLSVTTTDTADGKSTGAKTAPIAVADTATIGETVPASLSGAYGAPLVLAGISVSDNPNTGDTLTTVLKVTNGTITVGSAAGATVSGSGTGTVTLHGTQAAIDAAIAGGDYLAKASSAGTDTLSITTTDPTGRSSGTKSVAIAANAPSAPDLGLGLGAGPAGALNETNLSNPLFAGTSEPIGVVLLYDNGNLTGGGISGLQGEWAGAPLLPLAAGTQNITASTLGLFGFSAVSAPAAITEINGTAFGGPGVTQNVNFQAGAGNDTMQWANGVGVAIAGNGNNIVTAGNGADTVVLGNGNNSVTLGTGNDGVTAGTGKNSITVGSGNDTLSLGGGHDTIVLGNGDDMLSLGAGGNTITLGSGTYAIGVPSSGYAGGDTIILEAPQAELTMSYQSGDKIVFDNTGFDLGSYDGKGTGTPQAIGASLFSTSTNGTFATAADRFAYNQSNGDLYYDAQGNKAGSTKELVGQFSNDPHLTAANLFFIA